MTTEMTLLDLIAEVERRKGAWWRAVEDATTTDVRKMCKRNAYICDAFLAVVRDDDPMPHLEMMLHITR